MFDWFARRRRARHNLLLRLTALEEAVYVQMKPEEWAEYQDEVAKLVRAARHMRKLIFLHGGFKADVAQADEALKRFAHIPD